MAFDGGEIRLDPTNVHLDDVLDDIASGKLRVPNFQRPFVWRLDQMIDLFDSIERGYPIGSLLLWETDQPVPALPSIGGIRQDTLPPGSQVSYVLDGHQRLSTLFGVLRRPGLLPRPDNPSDWKWWVYRDLREDTGPDLYRHYTAALRTDQYLPLRAVSKTLDFLHFSRNLEGKRIGPARLGEMIQRAEAVAQRIKGYKVTLIRLRGAGIGQAVEVYTRLNRKGSRMDPDQMVSALTYSHRQDELTLANRVDDIVASVAAAEAGFGDVPRMAVFRAVLAIAGEQDIMSPHWEAVANRLQDRLHDAIPSTERAVNAAASFLRHEVHVPLAKLLPYMHQLVLLAAFFNRCPRPSDAVRHELKRWFWITSWSGAFAGANSSTMRRWLVRMERLAKEGGQLPLNGDAVQPMPDEFYSTSARTRAYMIWELHEFPKRLDVVGQSFDPVKLLASADSAVYRQVVPKDKNPANRLILPLPPNTRLLAALKDLPDNPRAFLDSHGIPRMAWDRLREGKTELFLADRTEFLARRLRRFAAEVSVPLGDLLVGLAEDDTE